MSITRPRAGNLLPLTNAVPERCFKPAESLITRKTENAKADVIESNVINSKPPGMLWGFDQWVKYKT